MTPQLEVQLIASIVAAACALPGVFLVLRRMTMMSDAISHTVLLGIVVAYMLTRDLDSPLLFVGAVLTGIVTSSLVEILHRTQLIKEDAAIGLVFPLLFSIAVIFISRFAANAHLDTDAVLLGELAFTPFDRVTVLFMSLPRALIIGIVILAINLIVIAIFYKEIKLATFDAGLATVLGFSPWLIHYGLMTMVSVTAVGAFDAVGSILVIALMVAPPATAYMLTNRLSHMIGLSMLIGMLSALSGYWLAHHFDVAIAGSIATMSGICFGIAYLFAPEQGIIATLLKRGRQRWTFAQQMLTLHLLHHEGSANGMIESRVAYLSQHLSWQPTFANGVVQRAEQSGLIWRQGELLQLTEHGRQVARDASLS